MYLVNAEEDNELFSLKGVGQKAKQKPHQTEFRPMQSPFIVLEEEDITESNIQ